MSVVLFCGPSLPPSARAELPAELIVRSPAECGDVLQAAQAGATHIGLIDGYFEHRPAVWHKEVLWALARGVYVYGSSSMGALRAAELAAFGMVGVGEVYAWFRSGALEDDDEVALVHEPEERDFTPRSDALVNVRATLQYAQAKGALNADTASLLITSAKHLYYPDRTLSRIVAGAAQRRPAASRELERFSEWLSQHGVVDQKRLDAQALVARMLADAAAGAACGPFAAAFRFERTDAFEALVAALGARNASPSHADCLRALALTLGEAAGFSPDAQTVQRTSEAFRNEAGLLTPEESAAWLEEAGLSLARFSELMYERAIVERYLPAAKRAARREQAAAALLTARGARSPG